MNRIKNIVLTGADAKPVSLDIFFDETPIKKPVVIYAHGFNGFKDWGNFDLIAKSFAGNGFAMVKFNFSHNGTTPEEPEVFADLEAFGNNNYSRQLQDLLQVTNWLCDPQNQYASVMDTENIFLIGHSMGGGIAILFTAQDARIKKLATWAAISECKTPWGHWPPEKMQEWKENGVQHYTNTRTNQQMPLYYQLYEDFINNREKLDIRMAIGKIEIPVLICHGALDISVPVENAYQLQEWQPSAELFVVESNHVFDRQHPWIMTYLPKATEAVVEKTISFFK